MDWSGLAQLAPVLAAGFTKNPGTVMNTINMTDKGKEAAYQRNLRDFGRELFSSGQIPDAQQVVALANKHGVRPADAMSTINNFMSWRQKRQQMKQADQAYQRGELDLTQTRNTMDRQQAQQELLGQYGDMPKQEFFAEAVKRGLVKPSPYGEMQGGLRPGTVSAMNYQTGLPEVLQNPAPTRQRANYQITSRGIFDPNTGAMKERFPQQPAAGGGYATDQAKLLDDNRSRWQVIMKAYMDPFGGVRDVEKYQEALQQFQADEQRIMSGQMPSWATGQQMSGGQQQPTHVFTRQGGIQPAQ